MIGVESGAADVLIGSYAQSKIDVQDLAAKARPVEQSGKKGNTLYPEHQNPDEGPYSDVHVEVDKNLSVGGAVVALGEIVAPATSGTIQSEDATPTALLSASAWDVVNALDPTGLSDAINWYFDID